MGAFDQAADLNIAMFLSGPYAAGILKRMRSKRKQERLNQSIQIMKRNRLIGIREMNGEQHYAITRLGKKHLLRFRVETLILPRKSTWDKKWRVIMFDIPERHGRARRALSFKLKIIGAFQLQKSVFVYPFPCQDEIDFISEFFQVSPYVRYMEANMIEGDHELKQYFDL